MTSGCQEGPRAGTAGGEESASTSAGTPVFMEGAVG